MDNVKYVNASTHNTLLRRSQVDENDLITKITGVGRMAVSSVPPLGFRGNINQHSVCIKTESRVVSEILAAYLNSDVGEKLASRRATGGTRPALDYPALRSIPIIFDERILAISERARDAKNQKEFQALEIFKSIDTFLLEELGIELPLEPFNSIEERIFYPAYGRSYGNRLDPFYHQDYFVDVKAATLKGKFNAVPLKDAINGITIKGYLPKETEKGGELNVVQINSIEKDGSINTERLLTAKNVFKRYQQLIPNDILVVITGATIGKVGFWELNPSNYYLGGDILKFQVNENFDPYYVFSYLRSIPAQIEIKRNITGATNGHLSPHDVRNLLIPMPDLAKQLDISEEIKRRRTDAFKLLRIAREEFKLAKAEIEKIILE